MINNFVSNDELVRREQGQAEMLRAATASVEEELNDTSIAQYLDTCWEDAKKAKELYVEKKILDNMRQIEGKYTSDKLRAIKQIGGSEVYMMVTDAKCKNAAYWVSDILFQPGQRPWGIEPTPVPELPMDIQEEIVNEMFSNAMQNLMMAIQQQAVQQQQQTVMGPKGPVAPPPPSPTSGMPGPDSVPDPEAVMQLVQEHLPEIEKKTREAIVDIAKDRGKDAELSVDDKLTEGGWYDAVRKSIPNIIMHTGFVKGPVLKKRKVTKITPNEAGTVGTVTTEEVYPCWESRHPLFIYPAPDSTDVNDGYIFDRLKLTPIALQELIGVDGYREDEIRAVLAEIKSGKLREWLSVDQELADIHNKISPLTVDSYKVDCLEFWGAVSGDRLIEWGKSVDTDGNPLQPIYHYNIIAYKIGRHVIGVQFNSDPLGRKNLYKTSFENRDGSFWGKGLPEVIYDVQTVCNACARAIVNNVGMASGPQVERNVDRIPPYAREDNSLIPWKVWDTTSDMMQTGPALQFFQPQLVVERLMGCYDKFSKIADEHSGVPAFAHGDPNVGGAGNTSSGLSMLMGAAARGIKALVTAIDQDIIKPSVERQYVWLIQRKEFQGVVCDYQIVTSGSAAALVKEQLAARRVEFMNATNNPIDVQLIGPEGRKYLLEETARSIQLDLRRLFPAMQMPQPMPMGQPGGAAPNPGSRELDQAGNPVAGQDTRQFNKKQGG